MTRPGSASAAGRDARTHLDHTRTSLELTAAVERAGRAIGQLTAASHLLALNARIEAGRHGASFAVIAAEM